MSAAKDNAEGGAMAFNRAALEPLFMPREFPNAHRSSMSGWAPNPQPASRPGRSAFRPTH